MAIAAILPGEEAGSVNEKSMATIDRMTRIEEATKAFMAKNGRRPCPADGAQDINAANFGVESPASGTCTGGAPAANFGPDAGTTNIVAGAVPTKTLALPDEYALDEFGRRYTYVVDKRATEKIACSTLQNYPTNNGTGGVRINDASGVLKENVMWALISHGLDGHGAFPAAGSTVANRMNVGVADADSLDNASVNAAFATSFDNVFVKKEKTSAFDDVTYYAAATKNKCCFSVSCCEPNPYDGADLIVGHQNSPWVSLYRFVCGQLTKIANLPDYATSGCGALGPSYIDQSPDNVYLAVSRSNCASPYYDLYKRSGSTYASLADLAVLPSQGYTAIAFSYNSTAYLAFGGNSPTTLKLYERSGDAFNALADPADMPACGTSGLAFSPSGQYLGLIAGCAPDLMIYEIDYGTDTFTKVADPAFLPAGQVWSVAWSADSQYMAVTWDGGGIERAVTVYKVDGATDTFTKLAKPTPDAPPDTMWHAAFSPDGNYLAIGGGPCCGYAKLMVYRRSGDAFNGIASQPVPPGNVNGIAFSYDSKYMAIAHNSSPYVTVYQITTATDTFTKIADPDVLPAGNGSTVEFRH